MNIFHHWYSNKFMEGGFYSLLIPPTNPDKRFWGPLTIGTCPCHMIAHAIPPTQPKAARVIICMYVCTCMLYTCCEMVLLFV